MKILFTDLDGTLLNEHSQVSPYTKRYMDEFIAHGNHLVLSSGRPLDSILEVKEKAGLNYPGMYIIANNGCLIYDCDNKTHVIESKLSLDQVSYLQTQALKQDLHLHTYSKEHILSHKEDEELLYYRRRIHLPFLLTQDYVSYFKKQDYLPYKMLAIDLTNHNKLEEFRQSLSIWADGIGDVQMLYSNDKYLEIFSKQGGKEKALTALCDYLHIPIANSIAAGDGNNDISMIKAAGCGIAMINASDEVKMHADIVTKYDNMNDGLAKIMVEII